MEPLGPGKITLSFYEALPGGGIARLKRKDIEYADIQAARTAALEALKRYPRIAFAWIDFTPTSGSVRGVERVER